MELTYDNIVEYIIKAFPQLVHKYKDAYEYADTESGMLIYAFFEPIVREHFYKLVAYYSAENDENTLHEIRRFSELFENMATSNDIEVRNLLKVGIFEGMEPNLYESARHLLGTESKKLLESWLMTIIQSCLGLNHTGVLDIATYNAIMNLAVSRNK